ncbi:MAG TPA: cytochrome c oxidase assembly protein [Chthoniobacter sp.]|jgi:cytochrome c oxidase assembly factor CtaG
MNTKQFLLSAWSWNPLVIAAAVAALIVYWIFCRDRQRMGYLVAALAVFLLALVSPINALADGYLFSAHMLQHIFLLLLVPALVLLALPREFTLGRKVLAHPLVGWLAGVGSMWLWHAPALCNAAVSSRPVYATQTISLLLLGGVFWWQVIAPREEDRLSPPAAVVYLFTACTACSALGIILTFSPVTVCPIYMHVQDSLGLLNTIRNDWGMTPEKDQQIGGLLMWVPMCAIYLFAILAQLARWFSHSRTEEHAR